MMNPLLGFCTILMACLPGLSLAAAPKSYAAFSPTQAQIDTQMSPAFRSCIKASGGVTSVMRDCMNVEYGRIDRQFTITYRKTLARLPSDRSRVALKQSQRQWIATRGASCQARARDAGGGTASLLVADSCGLSELARRHLWMGHYGLQKK